MRYAFYLGEVHDQTVFCSRDATSFFVPIRNRPLPWKHCNMVQGHRHALGVSPARGPPRCVYLTILIARAGSEGRLQYRCLWWRKENAVR